MCPKSSQRAGGWSAESEETWNMRSEHEDEDGEGRTLIMHISTWV